MTGKTQKPMELPNSDTHNCFACGRHNHHGLQMRFFSDGDSVRSQLTIPDHLCGWGNVVHGGIISTILDEIMAWTGITLLKKVTLTKSMALDFNHFLTAGEKVSAEGRVIEVIGPREAEIAGSVFNAEGKLCAAAKGNFTLLTPELALRLGVMNDELIKNFFQPLVAAVGPPPR